MDFSSNTITFNNQIFKNNFLKKDKSAITINCENIIYDSSHSTVYKNEDFIFKKIKVTKFIKDNYKAIFKKTKTIDEINGNRILSSFNMKVPDLKFYGLSLGASDYNEIIVMENMKDYKTIKESAEHLRQHNQLETVLTKIANDYGLLAKNGFYYRDFHFENVLVNKECEICWIDTGITEYKNPDKIKYKVNKKIKYLESNKIWKEAISENDWHTFKNNIILT